MQLYIRKTETVVHDHVRFRKIVEQWCRAPLGRGKKPVLCCPTTDRRFQTWARRDDGVWCTSFSSFCALTFAGQSRISARVTTPTRATAWLSNIGDYLQRTVEVTAWTSHETPQNGHVGQWPVQDGGDSIGAAPDFV